MFMALYWTFGTFMLTQLSFLVATTRRKTLYCIIKKKQKPTKSKLVVTFITF